jgi:hypothetical protein
MGAADGDGHAVVDLKALGGAADHAAASVALQGRPPEPVPAAPVGGNGS